MSVVFRRMRMVRSLLPPKRSPSSALWRAPTPSPVRTEPPTPPLPGSARVQSKISSPYWFNQAWSNRTNEYCFKKNKKGESGLREFEFYKLDDERNIYSISKNRTELIKDLTKKANDNYIHECKKSHSYYQWIQFVFVFLGFLFLVPHQVYNIILNISKNISKLLKRTALRLLTVNSELPSIKLFLYIAFQNLSQLILLLDLEKLGARQDVGHLDRSGEGEPGDGRE